MSSQVHEAEEAGPEQESPGDPPRGHPLPDRDRGWAGGWYWGEGGTGEVRTDPQRRLSKGLLEGWLVPG